jgi:hypothetical protein
MASEPLRRLYALYITIILTVYMPKPFDSTQTEIKVLERLDQFCSVKLNMPNIFSWSSLLSMKLQLLVF